MNKAVIKFVIALLALTLVYSVFWFFKVGQVEKQINNFVSESASNISVGQITVSGFPFSQKLTINDLKFSIPNSVLDKRKTTVKHLEAKSGIFSSEFVVTAIEEVSVQDSENTSVANVEFNKDPEIKISIADGKIVKFSYVDFGYRIVDGEKNTIYAASSSEVNIESTVGEGDKVTTRIVANIKDIEGFGALDIYKNSFEKKIIDGIKTGEIVVIHDPSIAEQNVLPVASSLPNAAPTIDPTSPVVDAEAKIAVDLSAAVSNTNLVKSNFVMDVEYILTPIQSQEQAQVPTDPTQIQEMPVQYSKVIKVTSLEFSNPLYGISVNGEMSTFQDDDMPSGSLSIKIDKVANLINYVTTGLNQMLEQKKDMITQPVTDVPQPVFADTNTAVPAAPVIDPYQDFLKKVILGLDPVSKEIAAKNAVSKEDVAVFDLRREKNLEFLVNETPAREILGKF